MSDSIGVYWADWTLAQFMHGAAAWCALEEEQLHNGRAMFGRDCCRIARFVGSRSCREVAARLCLARGSDEESELSGGVPSPRLASRRKRPSQRTAHPRKVSPSLTLTMIGADEWLSASFAVLLEPLAALEVIQCLQEVVSSAFYHSS